MREGEWKRGKREGGGKRGGEEEENGEGSEGKRGGEEEESGREARGEEYGGGGGDRCVQCNYTCMGISACSHLLIIMGLDSVCL